MMNVIPYREALHLMSEKFAAIGVTETLPTDKTVGRICAKDVFCPENLPPYRRSTVDGYALKSSDAAVCSPAAPAVLKGVGAVEMGKMPENKINIGECMYIPTGGMLPEGSDCVVMIEQTERIGEEICLSSSLSYMENVVEIGEDYKKGERIVEKGVLITAMRAAALAGAGVKTAEVVKKPKYFVISTGDELVNYDEECPLGKIRDVNTLLLTYAALLWECVGSVKVKDDYDKLKENIDKAAEIADIILLSGGSSVGNADYTERLLAEVGEIFIRGIALKPGKPTVASFGKGKIFIGLPGHPTAAFTVLKEVCLKAYERSQSVKERPKIKARSEINFPAGKGRTLIMPVKLQEKDGETYFEPLFGKSGMVGTMAACDGFVTVPDFVEGIDKGKIAEIELL